MTAPKITTRGLDPSLSHGALVEATWEFGDEVPRLSEYRSPFIWGKTKSTEDGLNKASTPEEMAAWGHKLISAVISLDYNPAIPLFVDWDEHGVMMKGQAVYANKTSFLIGYLIRGFQARGTPVIVLKPIEVRHHFGLKARAHKDEVWDEAGIEVEERINSDIRDGLLLSYVGAAGLWKRGRNG